MEPLNVSREDFPMSNRTCEGMTVLSPDCDNYEMEYRKNITYKIDGTRPLNLQLILPNNTNVKTPLIVYVPGSAFHKQNVIGRVPQLGLYASRGYAVALLEYTESDLEPFPQLILDAKCGVRYMKAHAHEYNIDSDKVVIMGDSSGAYTALMTGCTYRIIGTEDEYANGCTSEVRGIVDFYGPADFTTMNNEPSTQDHRTPDSPEGYIIGQLPVLEHPEITDKTIVRNYITKGRTLPPVLIFHGSNDELIPFGQSCDLYESLKSADKDVALYQMKGCHHGDRQFWSSTVIDIVTEFIDRVTKD